MLMPFGRYEGEEVAELSIDYLLWLESSVNLYGELKEAVVAALNGEWPEETDAMDADHKLDQMMRAM